jgi:DNA invertase Pin-like site-specific DNA recombinase
LDIAASTLTTGSGISTLGVVTSSEPPSPPDLPVAYARSSQSGAASGWGGKVRAALYLRVSTSDQFLEQQLEALTGYCWSKGYRVAGLFREDGKSAWDPDAKRPELERFWSEAGRTPRPFDVLVFLRLDRFSRRGIRETLNQLKRLEALGIRWESVTEPIFSVDNKLAREVMLAILSAFAEHHSDVTSERVKEARSAIEKGLRPGKLGGRPRRLTPVKMDAILKLKLEGKSTAYIAQVVGVPIGTVRYAFYLLRKDGRLKKEDP